MTTYLTRHTSSALPSQQQTSLLHLFSYFKSCNIWCFNFKICVSEKDYYYELHFFFWSLPVSDGLLTAKNAFFRFEKGFV